MGAVDAAMADHGRDIGDSLGLAVVVDAVGNIGRGVSAGIERDAAMGWREMSDLRFPVPMIASELVDEDDRRPVAGRLDVELHS